MKKIILICVAAIALCAACYEEQETGVTYRGSWNRDHDAKLIFINDSIVKAEFWSNSFVGYFNDRMSGIYEITGDSLMIIQWKEIKVSNEVYTKVPKKKDTLCILDDTLRRNIGKPYVDWDAYGNKSIRQEHYDLILESDNYR